MSRKTGQGPCFTDSCCPVRPERDNGTELEGGQHRQGRCICAVVASTLSGLSTAHRHVQLPGQRGPVLKTSRTHFSDPFHSFPAATEPALHVHRDGEAGLELRVSEDSRLAEDRTGACSDAGRQLSAVGQSRLHTCSELAGQTRCEQEHCPRPPETGCASWVRTCGSVCRHQMAYTLLPFSTFPTVLVLTRSPVELWEDQESERPTNSPPSPHGLCSYSSMDKDCEATAICSLLNKK